MAALFLPKARQFIHGRKNLLAEISDRLMQESRSRVWVHCASLGEFEQARPLLELIRKNQPEYCIVLSFFSPSGYEAQKNYAGADHVFYLPLDSRANAQRFIAAIQPALALLAKYEFWYHYLYTLQKAGIPAVLFSAIFQPRHPFFKWYGGLHRKMLNMYQQIFVQDEDSKKLLAGIQIKHVQVAGDTRFDRAAAILEQKKNYPGIGVFKNDKKLLIAGSTWKEDEVLLKNALQQSGNNYKLLVVPHEIHETHIKAIQDLFKNDYCLWNDGDECLRKSRVAIVNEVGHLSQLFRYADVAWIGGGYTRSGIHNVIEPAVFSLPVFFGPNFQRYREATDLIQCGGAVSLSNPWTFATSLQDDPKLATMGERAGAYVLSHLGATQKIYNYLITEKCFFNTAIKF